MGNYELDFVKLGDASGFGRMGHKIGGIIICCLT